MVTAKRVLIVEDEALVREMICGFLEELGYSVVGQAGDGQEAITLTQQLQPDVILMDISMPGTSGLEATKTINETCPTPIVILTAYDTQNLVQKASAAGAGAYLLKPAEPQEIDRAITIALARFDDMQALRQLNKELDSFANTVAHDVQNPLHLLLNYADLLQEEATLEPDQQLYLNAILRNGHKIGNIVNEIQVLAGVRQVEVKPIPLNMTKIVNEACKTVSYMAEEYQAQIDVPAEWPTVLGHPLWVEQVWTNYLSNAIKYGGTPPIIKLGATLLPRNHARFWVEDQGPGLTLAEQQRLFTPFERLDQVRIKGQGLGLSIVRHIVEKLGGETAVDSQPGQGSIFSFTLPLTTEEPFV